MTKDMTAANIESLREDIHIALNGGVHVSDFDRDCANMALAELVRRAEEAATLRTDRDRLAQKAAHLHAELASIGVALNGIAAHIAREAPRG